MKKKLALSVLSLFVLAGCSSADQAEVQDDVDKVDETVDESTAEDEQAVTLEGEASYDTGEVVNAKVTMEGDKIADVLITTIDTDGNAVTQLEQMSDPKVQDSAIGTEWSEQVAYLEDWIKLNGTADIETDENGKAVDEELLAGCDVNIDPILAAVNSAIANETGD